MAANDDYLNAAIMHQVAVRRFTSGQVRKIIKLLETADAELAEKLRIELGRLMDQPLNLKVNRMQVLLRDIRTARDALMDKVKGMSTDELQAFADVERIYEENLLKEVLPVKINLASVSVTALYSAVTQQPFAGGANAARTLDQWFDGLRTADQTKIIEAVQMGIAQGETVDDVVRRVVGTRKARYTDGILSITRRNAEAVVRTAINHISNAAREQVWIANADLLYALRWTSTLDGRTSYICRARDGALVPLGDAVLPKNAKRLDPPGARPPAHPNCRSLMITILSADGIADAMGDRPFVSDTRTGAQRQKDFRADAKEAAGDRWTSMSEAQRNDVVREIKRNWAAKAVGQVPSNITYGQWLAKQSADFQNEVLGKTKAQLFRNGGLKVEEFVDQSGHELTLAQLAELHPRAFMKAGLKAEDY